MRFGFWLPVFGGWLRNVEDEKMLIERATRLHPDDEELKQRAGDDNYPSRFRK